MASALGQPGRPSARHPQGGSLAGARTAGTGRSLASPALPLRFPSHSLGEALRGRRYGAGARDDSPEAMASPSPCNPRCSVIRLEMSSRGGPLAEGSAWGLLVGAGVARETGSPRPSARNVACRTARRTGLQRPFRRTCAPGSLTGCRVRSGRASSPLPPPRIARPRRSRGRRSRQHWRRCTPAGRWRW